MERNAMGMLVTSCALAVGVALVGTSAASAVVPSDPGAPPEVPKRPTVAVVAGPAASALDYRTVTVSGLRVRTGPGTQRLALGQIYRGQKVTVLKWGRDSHGQRWGKVKLRGTWRGGFPAGRTGWVTEAYLY